MNLTTLEAVKSFLEQQEDQWDGLITELIGAVSERAAVFCNRDFELRERTEYHSGGGQYLYLKGLPVVSITSIHGSDAWNWDEAALIPADHYQVFPAGMVAYRFGVWPYGEKAIRVIYTGGYAADAIPADLEMAVRVQTAYEFKRRRDIGLESVSFPDGSIQKVNLGEFLPEVKSVLSRYRIRPYG
ncbi:MAG: hypothetical protein JRI66_12905 [Deltaproteobacteria bacterium]|nr:hypothetical protein [Deltaproteobacteria bacterium]